MQNKTTFYYLYRQDTEDGKVTVEVVETNDFKKLSEKLRRESIENDVNIMLEEVGGDFSTVWGDEFEPQYSDQDLEKEFISFIRFYHDVEPLDNN